ncbi:SIR2 family protein [Rhodococcus fascians]|nr:SIR2 family protein [Rhodococcus fascians]MBY4430537.1 SIR2 family protein [Rhodococcus fascians]
MTTVSDPAAHAVTVDQVVQYLDGPFAGLARGVADGQYTFWLGSGISYGRVDGLRPLVEQVLEKLRVAASASDTPNRYYAALEKVLKIVGDAAGLLPRLRTPVCEWENVDSLLTSLVQNYAKVLDVQVEGEEEDYILWDLVDVRGTYGNPTIEPDVEHLSLAMLSLEGHLPQVVSANWDGLIEMAFDGLDPSNARSSLAVCVVKSELRRSSTSATRLLKFHGCAILAVQDEAVYRKMLVHRASQIARYRLDNDHKAMRMELVSLTNTTRTLMIGLSAQDFDIQDIFAESANSGYAGWPSEPPMYVFAEDGLGADQEAILKNVYGQSYSANSREIEERSLIRSYAKQLLVGLLLHTYGSKIKTLCLLHDSAKMAKFEDTISLGIDYLRDEVVKSASTNLLEFLHLLAASISRILGIFRTGKADFNFTVYEPISVTPNAALRADPNMQGSGLVELSIALGLLGSSAVKGHCDLIAGSNSVAVILQSKVAKPNNGTGLVMVANGRAAVQLEASGGLEHELGALVVIQSDTPAERQPRSPRSAPGRTGLASVSHFGMGDLIDDADDTDSLFARFREEVGF